MTSQLKKHVNFTIRELKELDGYDSANYCLETSEGQYLLKTYPFTDELKALIEAENEALVFLQKKEESKKYPQPIPFGDGEMLNILTLNGEIKICRLLSFLRKIFRGGATF